MTTASPAKAAPIGVAIKAFCDTLAASVATFIPSIPLAAAATPVTKETRVCPVRILAPVFKTVIAPPNKRIDVTVFLMGPGRWLNPSSKIVAWPTINFNPPSNPLSPIDIINSSQEARNCSDCFVSVVIVRLFSLCADPNDSSDTLATSITLL
ncbi:hypothetical protein D3C75_682560 [compost metagenome]